MSCESCVGLVLCCVLRDLRVQEQRGKEPWKEQRDLARRERRGRRGRSYRVCFVCCVVEESRRQQKKKK